MILEKHLKAGKYIVIDGEKWVLMTNARIAQYHESSLTEDRDAAVTLSLSEKEFQLFKSTYLEAAQFCGKGKLEPCK